MPSMTITTSAADAQRLATAIGAKLGLGRDATGAEIKAETVAYLVSIVRSQEAQAASAAAAASQTIAPT